MGFHLYEMKVDIAEKVAWVRRHLYWLLLLSLLLVIPRVQIMVIYFCPLLLSTALFVTALLTIEKVEMEREEHEQWREEAESSFVSLPEQEKEKEKERSLIECVAEQHQGGMIHFDTFFQNPPSIGKSDVQPYANANADEDEQCHKQGAESSFPAQCAQTKL